MSSIDAPRMPILESAPPVQAPAGLAIDRREKPLYRFAGVAVLVATLVSIGSITAYIAWPPPVGGAAEWFRLYGENAFRGMVSLDLPYILVTFLMLPVMLALFTALRKTSPTASLSAVALYAVTFAAMLASNPMVEMWTLSREFAVATSTAQQTALLGAGEALLASYTGTAFHLFYVGGQLAGIVLGVVMLRGCRLFTKPVAITMIVGNLVGFGLYVPTVGLALSVFSGVVLLVWMILLGRQFLELGAPTPAASL
jgi:hypothetical protein